MADKTIEHNSLKIKALWVCSWYPSRKFSNLATFIERQAKAVSILSNITILYVVGDTVSDFETNIEQGDFLIVRVYFPDTSNRLLKIIRQFRAQLIGYKAVLRLVGKPHIVHVQSLFPAATFALYLDFFKKIPFVVTEHYSGYTKPKEFNKQKLRKIFTRIVLRRAKVVLALSNYFIQALHDLGLTAQQFRVVFNVVDTELYKPVTTERLQTPVFQFTNLSLFNDRHKNITGIIRSTAKLAKHRQDFVVNFAGKGDDKDIIVRLADSLGVLNRFVILKGYLTEVGVAELLQKSDCLIMFSNIESQSVVTLEAASVGLPIIATETGGIGDRVTPETGILIDIGDEAALVEAMNYMIDNHNKYDPSVTRSKIVEKCSVEVVGQAIVSVYEEVLARDEYVQYCRR